MYFNSLLMVELRDGRHIVLPKVKYEQQDFGIRFIELCFAQTEKNALPSWLSPHCVVFFQKSLYTSHAVWWSKIAIHLQQINYFLHSSVLKLIRTLVGHPVKSLPTKSPRPWTPQFVSLWNKILGLNITLGPPNFVYMWKALMQTFLQVFVRFCQNFFKWKSDYFKILLVFSMFFTIFFNLGSIKSIFHPT